MSVIPDHTIVLQPRVQAADDALRPTRAEVDLAAIAHNAEVVQRVAGSAKVLAVVKADGYGHGVVPVARRLQEEGVSGFGVALAEEGLELRAAGVRVDILVLNGVYGGAHREVLEEGLTPVVYELRDVEAFDGAAGDESVGVHLKVDTGMTRLGVQASRLDAFLDQLERFPRVRIDGVMTHLACADGDDEYTSRQLAIFDDSLARIRARGHAPTTIHAGNSAATFRHPSARFDMVRAGLALFGYPGAPGVDVDLRPAMRLRTEVISLRRIEPGVAVGYDGTFRAERPTLIASLPVGYGDGLLRSLSNRGEVLVGGRRCPIVGNVSMDLTTVDVTEVAEVSIGDEVLLMGTQGDERLDAEDVARAAGTIPYEVLTNVSRRVPRFYRG